MKKTIQDYKEEIRFVRMELNNKIRECKATERELDYFRRFVRDRFEWYVELSAKNQHASLISLILEHVKFFNQAKPFDWGMLPRAF